MPQTSPFKGNSYAARDTTCSRAGAASFHLYGQIRSSPPCPLPSDPAHPLTCTTATAAASAFKLVPGKTLLKTPGIGASTSRGITLRRTALWLQKPVEAIAHFTAAPLTADEWRFQAAGNLGRYRLFSLLSPAEQSQVSIPFIRDGEDKYLQQTAQFMAICRPARDTKSYKGGAAAIHPCGQPCSSPPCPLH